MNPNKQFVQHNEEHPFGLPWLDSCYQQTFLPNSPWWEVAKKLNITLCQKVSVYFTTEHKKQMVFSLLGHDIVKEYFTNDEFKPEILKDLEVKDLHKLQINAQNFLKKSLLAACQETKCMRSSVEHNDISPEIKEFSAHADSIINIALERHLCLQEKEIWSARKSQELLRMKEEVKQQNGRMKWKLKESLKENALRGILKSTRRNGSAGSLNPLNDLDHLTESLQPNSLWGMESNSISRSLVFILKRDPSRFMEITKSLKGFRLPPSLRCYIWLDVLFKKHRQNYSGANIEQIVREKFGRAISRGVADLKLKRATHSPISALIDNVVIQIYDSTPGMQCVVDNDEHLRESARTLNITYVYDKSYEPYLVYWLFPIQLAFIDNQQETEHVYELAMYLNLLNQTLFPKWPNVFAIAEDCMRCLKLKDSTFFTHLKSIAQIDPDVSTKKDFMIQMLHSERTKAEEFMKVDSGSKKSFKMSNEILADPLIFIRKWIGDGFVSVLDASAVMWAWDQFMMQFWNSEAIKDLCLALLMLIKDKFMSATNYSEMRKIFFGEPCKLYTKDIVNAWLLLQNKDDFPSRIETNITPDTPSPKPLLPVFGILQDSGIKDISIYLRISPDAIERESWLKELHTGKLNLLNSIFYGSKKLRSIPSSDQDEMNASPTIEKDGSYIYNFEFPNKKLILKAIDLSDYEIQQDDTLKPFFVLRLDYTPSDKKQNVLSAKKIPLGWCRIDSFSPSDNNQWKLNCQMMNIPMNSGPVPESEILSPRFNRDNEIIGMGSLIKLTVFDPNLDRPIPFPRTPTPISRNQTPIESVTNKESFDILIDKIENLPDNATIIRINGEVFDHNCDGNWKIQAPPVLSSSSKSPKFEFKLQCNKSNAEVNSKCLLFLRIYTVDDNNGQLVVVGNSVIEPYENNILKSGGHCLNVHVGTPKKGNALDVLNHPKVPALRVYMRFIKHNQDGSSTTNISFDQYKKVNSEFSQSEKNIINSYKQDEKLIVKEEIIRLKIKENVQDSNNSDSELLKWAIDRLDRDKLGMKNPAENIDISKAIRYRIKAGLKFQIISAFGLTEGINQVYARINRGSNASNLSATEDGFGRDDHAITMKYQFNSYLVSPVWNDPPSTLHPHYDQCSLLIMQLFLFNGKYVPLSDHSKKGNVIPSENSNDNDDDDNDNIKLDTVGWTVLPLFEDKCVKSGEYHLPVFRDLPTQDMQYSLKTNDCIAVLSSSNLNNMLLTGASLVIKIFDGHFDENDLFEPLKRDDRLLVAVKALSDCKKVEQKKPKGIIFEDLLKNSLGTKASNLEILNKEKDFFVEAIAEGFHDTMDRILMNSGFPPL